MSELKSRSVLELSPQVVLREVEGEWILIHTREAVAMRLNFTGGEILALIDGTRSVADVIEEMQKRYSDTDRATVERSVLNFLSDMLEGDIVRVKDEAG